MPEGTVRRVRRMIAGLLVLSVLLFSGAQTLMAMSLNSQHSGWDVAAQIIAVSADGPSTPAHDDDCDCGPLCSIGGQCTLQANWIPAGNDTLPVLSRLAAAVSPTFQAPLPGIAIRPLSPPPRAIV